MTFKITCFLNNELISVKPHFLILNQIHFSANLFNKNLIKKNISYCRILSYYSVYFIIMKIETNLAHAGLNSAHVEF